MKKILFLTFTCLMVIVNVQNIYADDATIKMFTNKKEVEIGDNIEVSIDIEADTEIKDVTAAIIYDTDMLKYVTSSDNISNADGYLNLKDSSDKGGKLRTYIIEFKALKNGITQVEFGDSPKITNKDNGKITSSYSSVYIEITGVDEKDKDASLKSLRVSPGKLNKSFKSNLLTYSMTVDNDVTDIVIDARANSDSAKLDISGEQELKVGSNKVKVVVEAAAGEKREYTITVKRRSKEEQKRLMRKKK